MFAIANDRKSLWQWDLNQQLTVAGDCTEVHYLDRGAPSTLTVSVKDGKADIPNILLQKAGRLVVYAYIIDAQDHHTKVCEVFGISARPKPAEYVYTETEVKTWSDLQSQIGDLADLATDEKGSLVAAINEAAAGSGDISLGLTSATVGQTIKVKTADTDGRPTSWEAADMVSGSGEVWENVAEVTTTEEVASIELTLSDTCTKICVVDNVPPFESSDGKQQSNLRIAADDISVTVPTGYITPHYSYPQIRSYWIIPLGDISWTFMTDALMNNPFRELAVKGNYANYTKTTISKIQYSVSVASSTKYMIPAGTKVTVYGVKK